MLSCHSPGPLPCWAVPHSQCFGHDPGWVFEASGRNAKRNLDLHLALHDQHRQLSGPLTVRAAACTRLADGGFKCECGYSSRKLSSFVNHRCSGKDAARLQKKKVPCLSSGPFSSVSAAASAIMPSMFSHICPGVLDILFPVVWSKPSWVVIVDLAQLRVCWSLHLYYFGNFIILDAFFPHPLPTPYFSARLSCTFGQSKLVF